MNEGRNTNSVVQAGKVPGALLRRWLWVVDVNGPHAEGEAHGRAFTRAGALTKAEAVEARLVDEAVGRPGEDVNKEEKP